MIGLPDEPKGAAGIDAGIVDGEDNKGVIPKVLGVILIILGALDCALAWRGGFAVTNFYVLLLVLGIFFYCIGAVRGRDQARFKK